MPNPTLIDEERLDKPSASKFERLVACPGSDNLEKTLPNTARLAAKDYQDETAETGTIIHKARETGNTLHLDEEQAEIYAAGLECEKRLVENWAATNGIKEYREGPREERLWLHDRNTLSPLLSAKLDVHYLAGERMALVLDWKTGFSPNLVGSRGNWQLRVQALLLKQEHPDLEMIRVGFVKPRFETLDFADYTESDLQSSYDSILLTLWLSAQPDAVRTPGPQCRYCPCKGWCPEAAAYAVLPAVVAKQTPDAALMTWEQMVDSLAPSGLLKVFDMAPIVTNILEAVKARLKTLSSQELAALGLKLPEHGAKNDYVSNIPDAFTFFVQQQKFTVEDVLRAMQFHKGRLVELTQKERQLSKADAEKWLSEQLDPFMTKGFNEPSLRRLKE